MMLIFPIITYYDISSFNLRVITFKQKEGQFLKTILQDLWVMKVGFLEKMKFPLLTMMYIER